MGDAVLALPQDLKAVLRVVEDADVDDQSRIATAGAILHVLSAGNAIPGVRGILQHVGDVLLIRMVLEQVATRSPEAYGTHREDAPELFELLDEQLEVARSYLGEGMKVLEKVVEGLPKQQHEGHSAERCVTDLETTNWLYDAVNEAIVEQFEYDEDDVARDMKGIDRILGNLELRLKA